MLIKNFEARPETLATLEALLRESIGSVRKQIEKEIRFVRAGVAAERDSAYYIDFELGATKNWAVIHDLRLEVAGRVAQIDHLLINRVMEIFVLESKSVHTRLKITEEGEFLRWNDWKNTDEGMPSPLTQNDRHIAVLAEAMKAIELPSRLGLRLEPTFESYVLLSSNARIDRPKKFDTSRIVKSDDFVKTMRQRTDDNTGKTLMSVAKMISQETLERLGHQVASLHRPFTIDYRAKFGLPLASSESPSRQSTTKDAEFADATGIHACRRCQSRSVSIHHGRYGYYFKCAVCDGNTPIKISCSREGHKERIRKEGPRFFRECVECNSSSLFFVNPERLRPEVVDPTECPKSVEPT